MSEPRIAKLGLGTWAFGGRAYGPMDDDVSLSVARKAYELGIRQFDTAHIYAGGRSEELLGEALHPFPDARIITKIGYDTSDGRATKRYDVGFLENSLNTSLRRLKRSSLDLLLLHNPPTEILQKKDVFDWLKLKVREGEISRWGVSVYDSVQDAVLALDAGAQAIEARYSLLRRDVIEDLPKNKWSFDFIARSPLDGGLLSGKYNGDETFPKTDQRSATKRELFQTYAEFTGQLKPLIEEGTVNSLSELALRFTAFAPYTSIVIPGAKSIEQLQTNVDSVLRGPLPEEARQFIESLKQKFQSRIAN